MPGVVSQYWTPRHGKPLRIVDMDNGHLVNAIRWWLRRVERELLRLELSALTYLEDAPDGAALATEAGLSELESGAYDALDHAMRSPTFRSMVREAERRQLDWE